MNDPISTYLETHLKPQLVAYDAGNLAIDAVVEDIGSRLRSVIARWNDARFRRTMLFFGVEESCFYEPAAADVDVRALAVVCIRNSRLEDLASTKEAAQSLGAPRRLINDKDIPSITGDAIRFFASENLGAAVAVEANAPAKPDPFAGLPEKYPVAWRVIEEAARLTGLEWNYRPSENSGGRRSRGFSRDTDRVEATRVVLSGMDNRIDEGLAMLLDDVEREHMPAAFFGSLKGCTRNPEKLLRVMERLFACGAAFVTPNYYLSDGRVARRAELLRPVHNVSEISAQWRNLKGLSRKHRQALEWLVEHS